MSAEPPAAEPAEPAAKKPGFFKRIFSAPKNMSLPGCASIVLAIALIIIVIVVWTVFYWDENNVPWRHSMTLWRILGVIALTIIIPLLFYQVLRLWLQGERSQYPDIEFAWKAGLQALEQNGISLRSTPIFLVLGSPSERLEQSMMDASGFGLRVRGVPEGPGPLHWYANSEGVYLVCSEAGWLSALNTLVKKRLDTTLSTEPLPNVTPGKSPEE